MKRSGKIAILCLGALCAAYAATPLRAQAPVISRQKIDSLANPVTAAGGSGMLFETKHIDTGRIGEDDAPASYTFRWRNNTGKPLVITRVVTTCGCAVATYDRQPVRHGEQGSVRVSYHPKGHPGSFQRRIFVFTQLSDKVPTAVLELTGYVEPSLLPTGDYPHAMGGLLLKQRTVRIDGERVQSERIECLNAGERPLRITAERGLLPAYLSLVCDPEVFQPGKTGDLVIRFDPAKAPEKLPEQVPLILQGVDLPPLPRTIRVRFAETE